MTNIAVEMVEARTFWKKSIIKMYKQISGLYPNFRSTILISGKNPKIVALGMTYKPDSDDLRESPALEVLRILDEEGYNVSGYDNFVKGHKYESIKYIAKNADCIVVLVEHTEIKKELDDSGDKIKSVMKTPIILRIGTSYLPDPYDRRQRGQDE